MKTTMVLTIIFIILGLGISFTLTSGIIYLLSLCFNFTFSWEIAFGVWLLMALLRSVFGGGRK